MTARNTAATFLARVDRSGGADACHPWTAGLHADGYGIIKFSGKRVLAHRYAFFLAHGRWPEPNCLHKCDNRPCCNARHLFEGTQVDNIADMDAKGRRVTLAGERHGMTKLNDSQVMDIRANYALCRVTKSELARQFGISKTHVGHIISGRARSTNQSLSGST